MKRRSADGGAGAATGSSTGVAGGAAAGPAAVSSIGEDYLKAIWSAAEWGGAAATATALAERFGVTVATASDTVRRLASQGLLVHEPYRVIELTAEGERHALRMVRRHRLIETFLVTALGYGWHEVHDEAEVLEHAASDVMIARIDALLGHPDRDPHGDPIPAADLHIEHPAGVVALSAAPVGVCRIVRVADADPELLRHLHEHGLLPGVLLEVQAREPDDGGVEVRLERAVAAVPQALASAAGAAILVLPE